MRKITQEEESYYVKAYKRKVAAYKRNKLDVPSLAKIYRSLNLPITYHAFRKILTKNGIKWEKGSGGQGEHSSLEI